MDGGAEVDGGGIEVRVGILAFRMEGGGEVVTWEVRLVERGG